MSFAKSVQYYYSPELMSNLLFSAMWLFGPAVNQTTFLGNAPSGSGLKGPEVKNMAIYSRICKVPPCSVLPHQHNSLVVKVFANMTWLLIISEQHDRSAYLPASTAKCKIYSRNGRSVRLPWNHYVVCRGICCPKSCSVKKKLLLVLFLLLCSLIRN